MKILYKKGQWYKNKNIDYVPLMAMRNSLVVTKILFFFINRMNNCTMIINNNNSINKKVFNLTTYFTN